ncbi:MAG: hypothetical protein ABI851_12195 [Saprospiraceae bacterium]
MQSPILTPFEVRKNSPAGASYPLDNLRLVLDIIEYDFFNKCLGIEYYNALKKDARRWETTSLWDASVTYKSGEFAIYDGCVLVSQASENTTQPSPLNDRWKVADKFTKKSSNDLYNNFLYKILAFEAYKQAITYDTIKSSAKGLVVSASDNSGVMTAQTKDIEYVKSTIQKQIDILVEGMKCWIIEQHDVWFLDNTKGLDFTLVKFIKDTCDPCIIEGKSNRRIGFLE